MAYGAQVLVTYRDVPNVRQAFDGYVRLSVSWAADTRLGAFAVRPVRPVAMPSTMGPTTR
ncbi:hypothetical protein P4118_19855 [Pseudomonas aeruginosa]|nr:hypothetical protein [Pseudomonas aeruginosa]